MNLFNELEKVPIRNSLTSFVKILKKMPADYYYSVSYLNSLFQSQTLKKFLESISKSKLPKFQNQIWHHLKFELKFIISKGLFRFWTLYVSEWAQ